MDRVCLQEEWAMMPQGFDNIWGIVKDLGLVPSSCLPFPLFISLQVFNVVCFPHFSASIRPFITDEQEAFICRVLEIPFDERRCRDLINLDTLHAYCGGLKPTPAACRLNAYSCHRKFVHLSLFFIVFSHVSLSKFVTFPL